MYTKQEQEISDLEKRNVLKTPPKLRQVAKNKSDGNKNNKQYKKNEKVKEPRNIYCLGNANKKYYLKNVQIAFYVFKKPPTGITMFKDTYNKIQHWAVSGVTHAEFAFQFEPVDGDEIMQVKNIEKIKEPSLAKKLVKKYYYICCSIYYGKPVQFYERTYMRNNWLLYTLYLTEALKFQLYQNCARDVVSENLNFNYSGIICNTMVPCGFAKINNKGKVVFCSEYIIMKLKEMRLQYWMKFEPHKVTPDKLLEITKKSDMVSLSISSYRMDSMIKIEV